MYRIILERYFQENGYFKKFLLFAILPVIRREGYSHRVALRGNKRW